MSPKSYIRKPVPISQCKHFYGGDTDTPFKHNI
jgi:hypothetical protein